MILGLCEGTISGIGNIYLDKSIYSLSSLGFALYNGQLGQSPWAYLLSKHANEAIGYSNIAYVAASAYQLGTSPQLSNHNFEVYANYAGSAGNGYDADPSLVIQDLLTNPVYGVGFPAGCLAALSVYRSYCLANGLWISPSYTEQRQSSVLLEEIKQDE